MIQQGLDNDFSTIRDCGLSPKDLIPNDQGVPEYEWCIVPMSKLNDSPWNLSNGDELIAYVSAIDQN